MGASACQAVGYTSCTDRRRYWDQGYVAALRRIQKLTSELSPDALWFAAREASRNRHFKP